MTAIDWYYARGGKQMGPVPSTELKRLAAAGELTPDDLVWREGLSEWAPAGSVRGLFGDESQPAVPTDLPSKPVMPLEHQDEATPASEASLAAADVPPEVSAIAALHNPRSKGHAVDLLLDSLRSDFNAKFVEVTASLFRACGLYGLWIAMIAVAAFAVLSIQDGNALSNLLSGAMVIVLLVVLQYVAGTFCDALDRLNRTTNGKLTSTALPDGVALLCLVAALVALFGSVPLAVEMSIYPVILLGIAGFIIYGFAAFAALNPSTLHITIGPDNASTGHEAINVILFLLKVKIRCVPVVLGSGVIAGAMIMFYACYEAYANPDALPAAQLVAGMAQTVLVVAAALPVVMYLLFLLCYLVLDLCRAVLGRTSRES